MLIKVSVFSIPLLLCSVHALPLPHTQTTTTTTTTNIYVPHSIRAKMAAIAPELSKLTFSTNINSESDTQHAAGYKPNFNEGVLLTIDKFTSETYQQGYRDGLLEGGKKCPVQ
ncbi:hypothetical protein K493DRAFT_314591 [Basidiobolus meristosporus CBS 931.73]|uniref:Uncharacterized protein n=1 Tax=Basidiobolus meristosporus CBS 931.73 TaxID=1314790 RepID=A0A1Y1YE44_9FUNG|nr:hypothetical protein K493DRAFT_314591 [Basidiobolus meristosporus CBS 931.73]|eukprot:ORX96259.1 hypothetical protein K493DRAFT_314591 [Basidiobolus meristosporus CBS 931.73]